MRVLLGGLMHSFKLSVFCSLSEPLPKSVVAVSSSFYWIYFVNFIAFSLYFFSSFWYDTHTHTHRGDRTTSIHNNRRRYETPKRLELVHLDPSPQYCERNLSTGSLGTVDRPCNLTAHGLDSCDLLCCGRGHNIHQLLKRWQCRCKFIWCCHVKCDICHERIEQYTCK